MPSYARYSQQVFPIKAKYYDPSSGEIRYSEMQQNRCNVLFLDNKELRHILINKKISKLMIEP